MAASAGEEDIQDSCSENISKPPDITLRQQDVIKPDELSTNGTVSSSSFGGTSVLRPSVFSAAGGPSTMFRSSPSTGTSSQKSPFSLRPSIFGAFGSSDRDSGHKKPVVLRASQLESVTSSPVTSSTVENANSPFALSPAKLQNPFSKSGKEKGSECVSAVSSTSEEITNTTKTPVKANSSNTSNSIPEVPAPKVSFVPLASSTNANKPETPLTGATSAATTSVPSFVFGQNLHERVEVSTESSHRESEVSDGMVSDANSCDSEVSKTNGTTTEMLFTSVIQRELPDKQSEVGNEERKRKSLSEAAREYEESRAVKRKYEEVAVKTGEEEEINVLQINCKLFAFNKEKSTWVERGRGTLRLNDLSLENRTQSRVVMRVSGSLRVVLNTKIWAEMAVDRPSDKSVRLTAMDNSGEIKVFLVMAGVKEIDQLFKALEWRVNNQKKMASTCEKNSETSDS